MPNDSTPQENQAVRFCAMVVGGCTGVFVYSAGLGFIAAFVSAAVVGLIIKWNATR